MKYFGKPTQEEAMKYVMNSFIRNYNHAIKKLVEEDTEKKERPETAYYCSHCTEVIRLGEPCVVEMNGKDEVMIHARCYGNWLLKNKEEF